MGMDYSGAIDDCECETCLECLRREIERLRVIIPLAKQAREVAAAAFRHLNPDQIDTFLAELDELGAEKEFGLKLHQATVAAEAGKGGEM